MKYKDLIVGEIFVLSNSLYNFNYIKKSDTMAIEQWFSHTIECDGEEVVNLVYKRRVNVQSRTN